MLKSEIPKYEQFFLYFKLVIFENSDWKQDKQENKILYNKIYLFIYSRERF